MPVTSGSAGGLPGMSLKAWALVTSAGALVKGFNVASVSSGTGGAYDITFTTPMSSTNYVARATFGITASTGAMSSCIATQTTSVASVRTLSGGTTTAIAALWEFYE